MANEEKTNEPYPIVANRGPMGEEDVFRTPPPPREWFFMQAKRPNVAAVFVGVVGIAIVTAAALEHRALAQPNLPPPPPPPIGDGNGNANEVPSLPPPPPPSHAQPSPRRATRPAQADARALSANRRDADARARADEAAPVEPESRPIAITGNPIGLYLGRLSANVEVQLEPHHSLVISPNLLVFDAGRGGPDNVVSEGYGFASSTSGSFGVELGYHYWWRSARVLRGPFLGPSLLLGSTTNANVGDPSHAESYWGVAVDAGWQEVLVGGFTAGAGAGLEMVKMSGFIGVVPRALIALGWSF